MIIRAAVIWDSSESMSCLCSEYINPDTAVRLGSELGSKSINHLGCLMSSFSWCALAFPRRGIYIYCFFTVSRLRLQHNAVHDEVLKLLYNVV